MTKIKILDGGKMPIRKRIGDAGFDVYSPIDFVIKKMSNTTVGLKFCIELPTGFCALMMERSGHAKNHSLQSIGQLIDENYRGEIHIILHNSGTNDIEFKKDERIGQMLIIPYYTMDLIETDELNETERNEGKFGSSDKII